MDVSINETVLTAKILLVDDKNQNLISMESILEQDGYSFVKALSGKEALKILLKEEDFALILMDVNMPGLNGYETASLIYKRNKLRHIPIIFITAFDYNEENIFRGYQSGGIDYIFKPINPDLLKIKVKVFIELFKKNRQLLEQEEQLREINKDLQTQISEKVTIAEELQLKNLQLLDAQKLTNVGNWQWNVLSNKIIGSEEIYRIFEINPLIEDFSIEQMLAFVAAADQEIARTALSLCLSDGISFDIYFTISSISGKFKYVNARGMAVYNERNEIVKITGTSQDVTDIKQREEQLRVFSLLEKVLNEIYIFAADNFSLSYANAEALRNLGYTPGELKSLTILDILPDFQKTSLKRKISPLIKKTKEKIFVFTTAKRCDGTLYPIEMHLQFLEQGSKKLFLAVVLDLTERKRSEQILAASLREKETLLREIHHRVKNNLQIIHSLINLQSNTIKDPFVNEIFKESQNRIRSMALIHEKLYQHNNLSSINFTEYVNELIQSLINSYSIDTSVIRINIETQRVLLSIDISIALGLCITELVTNCFKYAFPPGRNGEIKVNLQLIKGKLLLIISDDGVGLPKDFDLVNTESLGLKIVETLVEQHNGILILETNGMTEFRMEIPLNKEQAIETQAQLSEY